MNKSTGVHWGVNSNNNRNCWILNWSDGNVNNNNLNNSNRVRPFAEYWVGSSGYNLYVMEKVEITLREEDAIIPFSDFVSAYYDCRKNKRQSLSALEFEMEWEYNVALLWQEVNTYTYEIGISDCFIVHKPKKREVFAASFRDRVIHHLLCRRIEPLFEAYFIDAAYNCRVGKGTLYGIKDLHEKIRMATNDYTEDAWVAKFDLQGFFMSVNRAKLWGLLERFLMDRYEGDDKRLILWLAKKITLHAPEKNCRLKSPRSAWNGLPRNKSLFTNGEGIGLPIGNLPSQMFVNFLLTEFDYEVSDSFWYGRYVDDFFLIGDKREILRLIPAMRDRLADLGLRMHPDKIYLQHYTKGIKFIGSVSKMDRLYWGNRTKLNFFRAIDELNMLPDKESHLDEFITRYNSYAGHSLPFLAYAIRYSAYQSIDSEWFKYIYLSAGLRKACIKRGSSEKYLLRKRIREERIYGFKI